MKLQLKTLCSQFHRAKASQKARCNPYLEELNPYLLEKVLWPTLLGNAPCLNAIDFDRFDEDDIGALCDYCMTLGDGAQELVQFFQDVMSIAPIPCRSRQFC